MAVGTPIRYAFKEEFESEGQRFFGTSYSVTGVIFAGGRVEGDVSLPARGQDVRHSGKPRGRDIDSLFRGGSQYSYALPIFARSHALLRGGVEIYPYLTTRKPFKYRNPTSAFTLAAMGGTRAKYT